MARIRLHVCSEPGCPTIFNGTGRCPLHRKQQDRARGSRAVRGYGADYEVALRTLKATAPTSCTTCGGAFTADNPLTGGHVVAVRDGGTAADGLKAECRRCNYGWRRTGS